MDFEVYCDESGQDLFRSRASGQRYVLIGGVWIKAGERPEHKRSIRALRAQHGVHGEFKWRRVSRSRVEFYKRLVGLFFDRDIRFRVVVLRADELDAVQFHDADNELMFYKFYYQLLHHWILDFNRYRIFVDTKTNRVQGRLRVLERCLSNANLSSKVEVQALPSQELDLIQLADVIIGAVSYRFHGWTTSKAKREVVQEIESHLPNGRIEPTPKAEEKFNVFRFRPGGGW
jgi:hypothetical protein